MLEYFRLAAHQVGIHLIARHAQRFRGTVEIEPVTRLVLHLGNQADLAAQARRPGDPVAFRLHADDFGMGVLRYLPDQRPAIGSGIQSLGSILFSSAT